MSVARARAIVVTLERRTGELLADGESAGSEQLGFLLTDVAGWRLRLEAERLRTKRRRDAAAHDAPGDARARELAEDLTQRHELLRTELESLQSLISRLRARRDELEAERGF